MCLCLAWGRKLRDSPEAPSRGFCIEQVTPGAEISARSRYFSAHPLTCRVVSRCEGKADLAACLLVSQTKAFQRNHSWARQDMARSCLVCLQLHPQQLGSTRGERFLLRAGKSGFDSSDLLPQSMAHYFRSYQVSLNLFSKNHLKDCGPSKDVQSQGRCLLL